MQYLVAALVGIVVSTTIALGSAGAVDKLGAGRNGANGMADPWDRGADSAAPRAANATEVAPFGAGRRGADGMTDPWYRRTHTGAGDAPLHDASRDNSVPNGH